MQMAQNKGEVFRNGAACALRRKKKEHVTWMTSRSILL
nr:MAG TPA_asm: hypothetical protein [Caudoviricetes sp.]